MSLAHYHAELADDVGGFTADPLGFVMYNWPWGVAGTPLADEVGPEAWQRDILEQLGRGVLTAEQAVRVAIASGHGVGKSALVAWIVIWAMATCPDTRGVVTANTEMQLRTKTWAELAKWHRMGLVASWFTQTATALYSADPRHEKTWRIDAVPWSEAKPEAFAGLHNQGRRIVVIYDEGSTIPDSIFETTEGAMTDDDTEIVWAVFGNPTRNTGRFRECFAGGRFAHRWSTRQIDSRTITRNDSVKRQATEWAADYGEDSDFVRIRVKGEFPRAGSLQFIDGERVDAAMRREIVIDAKAPLVMGVDIARHGEDETVIRFRRGLDARSIEAVKIRLPDLMQIASRVMEAAEEHSADAVFVDATGIGWGVYDRLKQLGCRGLVAVDFGGKPDRADKDDALASYANKRAEMWGWMKNWCKVGCLPNDRDLTADLTGVEYGYDVRNAILLEKKDDMRKRGLASPDNGDALALTFAYGVAAPRVRLKIPRSAGGWMAA